MDKYFIKVVDAPGLINMEGKEALIEFSHRARNQRDIFKECSGFLLYEKYRKYEGGVGSKCVFAKGYIKISDKNKIESSDCHVNGKDFPTAMKTIIDKTLSSNQHHHGLSIKEINEICPNLDFRPMPKVGGLYPISKAQFDALSVELENRN